MNLSVREKIGLCRVFNKLGPSGRKKLLAGVAALLFLFVLTGVFARLYPEAFFSTRAGRAVGAMLLRRDFVRSYVERRPEILINPRTVSFALRSQGLDDIENFRAQLRRARERMDWDSLSPSRKRRYFEGVYDSRNLKYGIPFIMSLPEEHREELVLTIADMIYDYRTEMTFRDEEELRARLNSPEGRRMLSESQRVFLTGLTPEQMEAVSPIVDEIVILAAQMLN